MPHISTVGRIRNLYERYRRWRYTKEYGLRLRNNIHSFSTIVYPYISVLIPNFRVAHYVYIIFWCIVGSILIYPVRNMPYIDVLFFSTGASTQAGLNTVDLNTTALYQQIVIYIVTTFTTPIFIHGSILVFRLCSFERHFDDIKESSKLNFKMRRSATLAAANSHLQDPTLANTRVNQGLGLGSRRSSTIILTSNRNDHHNVHKNVPEPGPNNLENGHRNGSSDIYAGTTATVESPKVNFDYATKHLTMTPKRSQMSLGGRRYSTPQDPTDLSYSEPFHRADVVDDTESIHSEGLVHRNRNRSESDNDSDTHDDYPAVNHSDDDITRDYEGENIRFADLPQPLHKRRNDINPSDMLRLIAMNRAMNGMNSTEDNDDSEPALKIRLPNEIENGVILSPKKKRRKRRWSKRPRPRNFRRKSYEVENAHSEAENDAENESIDSEVDEDEDDVSRDDREHPERRRIAKLRSRLNEIPHISDDEESTDDKEGVQRAQSHLVLPLKDETGGKKFGKRSATLEVEPDRRGSFIKSPTFEKMINRGRKLRPNMTRIRSGLRPSLSNAVTTDEEYDSDASFDSEASSGDNEDHRLNRLMSGRYLSWVPTVGRNSTFVHLTADQKEELGGVEYRAVKLLVKIVLLYYIGFHIIAFILLFTHTLTHKDEKTLIDAQGVSPGWWAVFQAQSSFNDLGLTLTNNSLTGFSKSVYVMIVVSFFVVIGNTGFPIFLRFIIWILFICSKPLSLFKESLGFLLDHPRRCFTLLFPSIPTWWLFFILVVLNAVDLILFIILDLNNEYLKDIPIGIRVMDGLFQAFSTRTAGFAVVDLSQLHPAVQVSYMLMMYISVLPLAISIRRTNVYEEQSLGVYVRGENEENGGEDPDKTPQSFIGAHLRNQLSFDLWFIFLALFIICIAEGGKLNKNDPSFSVFKVLFEIISAYGTVGLLLGYPGINASFSAEFSTISKLVIIALMIRGRHRGLPYSLDRAIMLPDAAMERRDALQEHHAVRRHNTMASDGEEGGYLNRVLTRRMSNIGLGDRFRRRSSKWMQRPTPATENHEMTRIHTS